MASARPTKVFVGGLSWATDDTRLRQYFSNFGEVAEAFVSYERATGRPRGFGFVVFADAEVASRVVSQAHTIDRREVEAKRAVPKEEGGGTLMPPLLAQNGTTNGAAAAAAAAALMLSSSPQQRHPQQPFEEQQHSPLPPPPSLLQQQLHPSSPPPPAPPASAQQALAASLPSNLDLAAEIVSGGEEALLLSQPPMPLAQQLQPSRKLFVGGLPPSCDDASLRAHFEQFGPVDEAVVMVDHESKRSRGFAFVTMMTDAGLDCVLSAGAMHCLHDKPVEVKRAVPRDQMAAATVAAAQAQAAAAVTVRAAAAAAAVASAPRNCWEPPLSSSGGNGNRGFYGGGPGFVGGGSLAAELEALSFHGGGGGDDFFRRPRSPYGGRGNAPFDRSAFDGGEVGSEREAALMAAGDDSGLVAFLARQQQRQHSNGNGPAAPSSAALRFERLRDEAAPAPSSTHSLSPPEGRGGGKYRSLYASSDVFGPPSASAVVGGFPASEASGGGGEGGSSGGEGGGRNSSGEHQRDEERCGRGFEFNFPAAGSTAPPAPRSPCSDSLGGGAFGFGDGNGKGGGEW